MDYAYLPGKLLIGIVGRHRGDLYVEMTKAAGARGGTVSLGYSFEGGKLLQALALDAVQQDVVFTLMGPEAQAVIAAVKESAAANPKKLGGMAVVVDVSGMRLRGAKKENSNAETLPSESRSERMESGYTLITVIVNSGCANDVMTEARNAGATGGTILTARGTGTQEDVKFFGITLVPEKEILMIVAANDTVEKIQAAINEIPLLCEPGGGIVYNMNVEEFISLGKKK